MPSQPFCAILSIIVIIIILDAIHTASHDMTSCFKNNYKIPMMLCHVLVAGRLQSEQLPGEEPRPSQCQPTCAASEE